MPVITDRARVFWMPQDELATITCGDLSETRWVALIEMVVPGCGAPGTVLAERLKFYASLLNQKARQILVGPAWVAEAIVEHCNGHVADLSLGEYLGFLCEERAKRLGALGSQSAS